MKHQPDDLPGRPVDTRRSASAYAPDPLDRIVALGRSPPAGREPPGYHDGAAEAALRDLFLAWGLDAAHAEQACWNPLGDLVPAGAAVVLKPNWVLHRNELGHGLDCLITHTSVIEAVLGYLARCQPGRVVLGDAPLQGCDFAALRQAAGVDELVTRFRDRGMDLHLRDFRRTILLGDHLGAARREGCRGPADYVLFDLGRNSLLEALAHDADRLRVTMYNPDLLRRTHGPGKHRYLIAREIVEADVILNLPKLKTHRKSGLTGALKNLVGINGNKEFLPHHRKGGASSGGDCYDGGSRLKGWAEDLLDRANRGAAGSGQALWVRAAHLLLRGAALLGEDVNIEGAWHGNDTVWRTCLDLQRIAHYGGTDGRLAAQRARRVVTITDAIIAGEGEGPLANSPIAAGFLCGAVNPAAADWIGALLMGFDPRRIPLTRESFGAFPYPLAGFAAGDIRVRCAGPGLPGMAGAGELSEGELRQRMVAGMPLPIGAGRSFVPAQGWRGHCELTALRRNATGQRHEPNEYDSEGRVHDPLPGEPSVLA